MFQPGCRRVAVFQPRPGLGDLIWHLPLIRAIASATPAGRVTLIVKPSTQADSLLDGDPAIDRLVWFHGNPRRGEGRHDGVPGFVRLARTLSRQRLDACVLLHHSPKLAAAMALAGIAGRYGYGYGVQRRWLTRPPFLDTPAPFTEAAEQAAAYGAAAGFWPLHGPCVAVRPAWTRAARARLSGLPRPLAVLGIGSHGADRQWGVQRFARLAAALAARGMTVLIAASGAEAALASDVGRLAGHDGVRQAVGWPLQEIAACLAEADLFIGNDSGLMNLRAALGRRAYGLFGASGPLRHNPCISAIVPPGGPRAGMETLDVRRVLAALRADGAFEKALRADGAFEKAMTTEPRLDRSSLAVGL